MKHQLVHCTILGTLCAVWMYAASQLGLVPWVGFITWASFFLLPCSPKFEKVKGLVSYGIGIGAGFAIALIGTALVPTLGSLAFPAAVFIAVVGIVATEKLPPFNIVPLQFLGAASFFASGLSPEPGTLVKMMIPAAAGIAFGYATKFLRFGYNDLVAARSGVAKKHEECATTKSKAA